MQKEVKEVAGTCKKQQTPTIYHESNQPILSEEKVTKTLRGEQYIENLFSDERPPLLFTQDAKDGPEILQAQIIRAISSVQSKKSPGPDKIPIEPETY